MDKKARKMKRKVLREIRKQTAMTISPRIFMEYTREALIIDQFTFQDVDYDELQRIKDYVCIFCWINR